MVIAEALLKAFEMLYLLEIYVIVALTGDGGELDLLGPQRWRILSVKSEYWEVTQMLTVNCLSAT